MASKTFTGSREEMEQILQQQTLGYLGLTADSLPYVVPLNYAYAHGKIFFHCAHTGKKLDLLRANPQVCFTVARQAGQVIRHPQGAVCHGENDSVICYGTARVIEDLEERRQALNFFNQCMQPGAPEITREAAAGCSAVEITISEMTGRQQRGTDHIYYRYHFL